MVAQWISVVGGRQYNRESTSYTIHAQGLLDLSNMFPFNPVKTDILIRVFLRLHRSLLRATACRRHG